MKSAKNDSDIVMQIDGFNVTVKHLKNIVTDAVSPITAHARDNPALAQQHKNGTAMAQGVPVFVEPVLKKDTEWNKTLGLNMTVGWDAVNITGMGSKTKQIMAQSKGVPVFIDPHLMINEMSNFNFETKILVGQDEITFKKNQAKK